MKRFSGIVLVALLTATWSGVPAWGWGPRAQQAIITMATRIISLDGTIPLTNLERDILAGASVSSGAISRYYPSVETDLVGTIDSEMRLLQSMRGGRIDPYYAFRLGTLGKLAARASAPMATAPRRYRDLYYADAESYVENAGYSSGARKHVDPSPYFDQVRLEANRHVDVIQKDYQEGMGFAGVARASLSDDASRSVRAVADVWHTIVTGTAIVADVSVEQSREYAFGALEFYLNRGNQSEVNGAHNRILSMPGVSADVRMRTGDTFYDAGQFDRAMTEYQAVLNTAPGRRDAIERIASYYVRVADEARAGNNLENARDAYARALQADKLHPNAQIKLIEVEQLIAARQERLDQTRSSLETAAVIETRAEEEGLVGRFARGLSLLAEAQTIYAAIGNEFRQEQQAAIEGLARIANSISEFDAALVREVEESSRRSGVAIDAKRLATSGSERVRDEALRQLVVNQHSAQAALFNQELRQELKP